MNHGQEDENLMECLQRERIPKKGITVFDDFSITKHQQEHIKKELTELKIYKIVKEDCPCNKPSCPITTGAWACEQYFGVKKICIHLPAKMKEEDVISFFKPLIDIINSKMH